MARDVRAGARSCVSSWKCRSRDEREREKSEGRVEDTEATIGREQGEKY